MTRPKKFKTKRKKKTPKFIRSDSESNDSTKRDGTECQSGISQRSSDRSGDSSRSSRISDKSISRSRESKSSRISDRSRSRSSIRISDRSHSRSSDKSGDRSSSRISISDRSHSRSSDKSGNRSSDRSSDKSNVKISDKSRHKSHSGSSDRRSDISSDISSNSSVERISDESSDVSSVRISDKNSGRSNSRSNERSSDTSSYRSFKSDLSCDTCNDSSVESFFDRISDERSGSSSDRSSNRRKVRSKVSSSVKSGDRSHSRSSDISSDTSSNRCSNSSVERISDESSDSSSVRIIDKSSDRSHSRSSDRSSDTSSYRSFKSIFYKVIERISERSKTRQEMKMIQAELKSLKQHESNDKSSNRSSVRRSDSSNNRIRSKNSGKRSYRSSVRSRVRSKDCSSDMSTDSSSGKSSVRAIDSVPSDNSDQGSGSTSFLVDPETGKINNDSSDLKDTRTSDTHTSYPTNIQIKLIPDKSVNPKNCKNENQHLSKTRPNNPLEINDTDILPYTTQIKLVPSKAFKDETCNNDNSVNDGKVPEKQTKDLIEVEDMRPRKVITFNNGSTTITLNKCKVNPNISTQAKEMDDTAPPELPSVTSNSLKTTINKSVVGIIPIVTSQSSISSSNAPVISKPLITVVNNYVPVTTNALSDAKDVSHIQQPLPITKVLKTKVITPSISQTTSYIKVPIASPVRCIIPSIQLPPKTIFRFPAPSHIQNPGIHVLRPTGIRLVPASPAQFSLSQNNIISSPPHFTSPTTTTVSCYGKKILVALPSSSISNVPQLQPLTVQSLQPTSLLPTQISSTAQSSVNTLSISAIPKKSFQPPQSHVFSTLEKILNKNGSIIGYRATSIPQQTPYVCVSTSNLQSNINNAGSLSGLEAPVSKISAVTNTTMNSSSHLPVIDKVSSIPLNSLSYHPVNIPTNSSGLPMVIPSKPVTFVGTAQSVSATIQSQSATSFIPLSSPIISQVSAAAVNPNPQLAKAIGNIKNLFPNAQLLSSISPLSSRPSPIQNTLGLAIALPQTPVTFVGSIQSKTSTVVHNSLSSRPVVMHTPAVSVINSVPLSPVTIATTHSRAIAFSNPSSSNVSWNNEPILPMISPASATGLVSSNPHLAGVYSNIRKLLPPPGMQVSSTSRISSMPAPIISVPVINSSGPAIALLQTPPLTFVGSMQSGLQSKQKIESRSILYSTPEQLPQLDKVYYTPNQTSTLGDSSASQLPSPFDSTSTSPPANIVSLPQTTSQAIYTSVSSNVKAATEKTDSSKVINNIQSSSSFQNTSTFPPPADFDISAEVLDASVSYNVEAASENTDLSTIWNNIKYLRNLRFKPNQTKTLAEEDFDFMYMSPSSLSGYRASPSTSELIQDILKLDALANFCSVQHFLDNSEAIARSLLLDLADDAVSMAKFHPEIPKQSSSDSKSNPSTMEENKEELNADLMDDDLIKDCTLTSHCGRCSSCLRFLFSEDSKECENFKNESVFEDEDISEYKRIEEIKIENTPIIENNDIPFDETQVDENLVNAAVENPPKLTRENPSNLTRENSPELTRENPLNSIRENPPNSTIENPPELTIENPPTSSKENPSNHLDDTNKSDKTYRKPKTFMEFFNAKDGCKNCFKCKRAHCTFCISCVDLAALKLPEIQSKPDCPFKLCVQKYREGLNTEKNQTEVPSDLNKNNNVNNRGVSDINLDSNVVRRNCIEEEHSYCLLSEHSEEINYIIQRPAELLFNIDNNSFCDYEPYSDNEDTLSSASDRSDIYENLCNNIDITEHYIKTEPKQNSENCPTIIISQTISLPASDRTLTASAAQPTTTNKSTKRKQHFGGFLDVDLQTVDPHPPKKQRKRRPKISSQEKLLSLNEIKGTLGLKKINILDNMSSSFQRDTTKVTRKNFTKRPQVRKKVVDINSAKAAVINNGSVKQKIKRKKEKWITGTDGKVVWNGPLGGNNTPAGPPVPPMPSPEELSHIHPRDLKYLCIYCHKLPCKPNRSELYRHYATRHLCESLKQYIINTYGVEQLHECPICKKPQKGPKNIVDHYGQVHSKVELFLPEYARIVKK